MYLPALPGIAGEFGVDVPRIQVSVGLFLLGLGLGQFVGAPVSDRYGRRPTAFTGVAIFAVSTIGIVLSRTADPFIALRLVQGLGAGVAIVNIGAVVGDLFDTEETAGVLNIVSLIQVVGRLAAPVIGALILTALDWRAIFYALLLYCAVVASLLWFRLPETVAPASAGKSESLARLAIRGYTRVFGHTKALGYAICLSFSTGCMFVYLADAAFIYMEWFGVSAGVFSGLLALNVLAFGLCAVLNFRLLKKHPAHRILVVACGIQCLATCVLLAHVTLTTPSLPVVILLLMASMGVVGLSIGNAGACLLGHFPDFRGTASGVAGSMQFLVGGLLGTSLGIIHTGTPTLTALLVTLCAVIAALSLGAATPPARTPAD